MRDKLYLDHEVFRMYITVQKCGAFLNFEKV